MLHTRIIPVLTFKDGRMIKTIQFDEYRDVGDPVTTARFYDSQDVDELVLLDITATQEAPADHILILLKSLLRSVRCLLPSVEVFAI